MQCFWLKLKLICDNTNIKIWFNRFIKKHNIMKCSCDLDWQTFSAKNHFSCTRRMMYHCYQT